MRKMMLLGMGRSGTHAVIQWVANGLGGVVRQENNCFNGWDEKKFIYNSLKTTGKGELVGIIKSIDDFYLPLWDKLGEWEKFDRVFKIIRSPRNWLASSIAAKGFANEYLEKAPNDREWIPVSRIAAYIRYVQEKNSNSIIYDDWYNCDESRAVYADMLKIKNSPKPSHCKFSSFGKNHDYTGDRYQLLNPRQKERFDYLYEKYQLGRIQERYFG